jgi:hypothetical protein
VEPFAFVFCIPGQGYLEIVVHIYLLEIYVAPTQVVRLEPVVWRRSG